MRRLASHLLVCLIIMDINVNFFKQFLCLPLLKGLFTYDVSNQRGVGCSEIADFFYQGGVLQYLTLSFHHAPPMRFEGPRCNPGRYLNYCTGSVNLDGN